MTEEKLDDSLRLEEITSFKFKASKKKTMIRAVKDDVAKAIGYNRMTKDKDEKKKILLRCLNT